MRMHEHKLNRKNVLTSFNKGSLKKKNKLWKHHMQTRQRYLQASRRAWKSAGLKFIRDRRWRQIAGGESDGLHSSIGNRGGHTFSSS